MCDLTGRCFFQVANAQFGRAGQQQVEVGAPSLRTAQEDLEPFRVMTDRLLRSFGEMMNAILEVAQRKGWLN